MSRLLSVVFAFLMLFSFAPASKAQTAGDWALWAQVGPAIPSSSVIYPAQTQSYEATPRVILGGTGGTEFGNSYIGALTAVEIPIKHFELDFSNTFSPYESHVALGKGYADQFSGRGILWTPRVGFFGGATYSMYHVNISKALEYAHGGVVLRSDVAGVPARFFFTYTHELNNGLFPHNASGTETSRLQSGAVQLEARLQCNRDGNSCLRLSASFDVGVVKNQSNPVCDGSLGIRGGHDGGPCYRKFTLSGGASFGLSWEIRHKTYDTTELF